MYDVGLNTYMTKVSQAKPNIPKPDQVVFLPKPNQALSV